MYNKVIDDLYNKDILDDNDIRSIEKTIMSYNRLFKNLLELSTF